MTPSLVVLPDDLIAEILSFLPVKPLLRFRSVSKSWKTPIFDPTFVKLHLKRSAVQNPHFTLITGHEKFIPGESLHDSDDESERDYNLVPYPISRLLDNPSFTLLLDDPYYHVTYYHVNNDICSRIIGSCNGLICLAETSLTHDGYRENWRREYWLRVWNPSIRTTSEKFGYFCDFGSISRYGGDFNFKFGFDNSTDTYKVVVFRYNRLTGNRDIKILGSGDHVWRDIAFFPVVPLRLDYSCHSEDSVCDGVYLSGTFNWLAIHNELPYRDKNIRVEHFVIVSLDLGTETYNQYLLPRSFDEVPSAEPTVGVLGGCLCFSHSYKETDYVIWKMKKFGDEDSWSQFLKISYQNLQIEYYDIFDTYFRLVPLFLSKDGDTLILKSSQEFEAIIYHWKDNRVQRTKITLSRTITYDRRITNWVCWESAKDYVESLVPIF